MSKSNKEETGTQPGLVKKQFGTIYKVVAAGFTVDWTDKFSQAMSSYKEVSTYPKTVYQIDGKSIQCIQHTRA